MTCVKPPLTIATLKPSRLSVRTNVRAPGVSRTRSRTRSITVLVEPGQQRDALAQRCLEVELARHRAGGDVGDLVAAAGLLGQQFDDLVLDQGRVDVQQRPAA